MVVIDHCEYNDKYSTVRNRLSHDVTTLDVHLK